MKFRFFVFFLALAALLFALPARADCADDACGSIKKILEARSGNFSKIKGKPGLDPRGDPVWEGTQAIADLINHCTINKRGEGSHYEYRCESQESRSLENAKKIADGVKAAFQSADPMLVWFEDPAALALADIEGFHGTDGWYGGYAKNKAMLARIEIVVSDATGSTVVVTVFAKPLTRRDLR
jgi:hypothetical protein